ncbi:MAG: shikimate dehydrogenase [Hyphomicrobiales bacterium]
MENEVQQNSFLKTIKLGLIGDNIARSKAPNLHVAAGKQCGVDASYERLIPRELGKTFLEVFEMVETSGFRGINITYPYKETATSLVAVKDPLVKAIGAVNTVVFEHSGPVGYNTDYSGFIEAYRTHRNEAGPGIVCLIGSGGVGKAVAFGLVTLGATVIRCVDLKLAKAQALANALSELNSNTKIEIHSNAPAAARGADGIVNCTPVGMVDLNGTPLPAENMSGGCWAFDAVYTPVETEFLTDAKTAGLDIISGYELFLGQGVDAWTLFSGHQVNKDKLRAAIAEESS